MAVPAQSSKRQDLPLIWEPHSRHGREGALPVAHRLTPLHFANNFSPNPQLKHHGSKEPFLPVSQPPPHQPLYCHSSLCRPLYWHVPHHD